MRVPVDWLGEYAALPADADGAAIAAALVRVGLEEEGLHSGGVGGPLVVGRVLEKQPGAAEERQDDQLVPGRRRRRQRHRRAAGHRLRCAQLRGGRPRRRHPARRHAARPARPVRDLRAQDLRPRLGRNDLLGPGARPRRGPRRHHRAHRLVRRRRAGPGAVSRRASTRCRSSAWTARPSRSTSPRTAATASPSGASPASTPTRPAPPSSTRSSPLAAAAPAANGGRVPRRGSRTTPRSGAGSGCDRFVTRVVRGVDPTAPEPGVDEGPAHRGGDAADRAGRSTSRTTSCSASDSRCTPTTPTTLTGPIVVRRARPGERLRDPRRRRPRPRPRGPAHHRRRRRGRSAWPASWAGRAPRSPPRRPTCSSRPPTSTPSRSPVPPGATGCPPRRPGASSGASTRSSPPAAAQLAVDLLVSYGGGTADPGVTDVGSPPGRGADRRWTSRFPARIVGVDYARRRGDRRSSSEIGCAVDRATGTLAHRRRRRAGAPTSPTAEDLVEEVARIHGYDEIPSVAADARRAARGLTHDQRVRRLVATVARRRGAERDLGRTRSSARTGSPPSGWTSRPRPRRTVRLANPLSDEAPLMRTAVVQTHGRRAASQRRPGRQGRRALRAGARRRPRRATAVRARPRTSGSARRRRPSAAIHAAVPRQPRHVGMLLAGDRDRAGWWGAGRRADVADVVELARSLGEALGVELDVARRRGDAVAPGTLRPGGAAPTGPLVGHAGELHPKVVAALGLPARTVGGELDLDVLTAAARGATPGAHPRDLPDGPERRRARRRRGRPGQPGRGLARSAAVATCSRRSTLFDVYEGDQVGEGRKSLAFRLTFRSAERTLTTEEVVRGSGTPPSPRRLTARRRRCSAHDGDRRGRGRGRHRGLPGHRPARRRRARGRRLGRRARLDARSPPVTDRGGRRARGSTTILARTGRIDLLVNNAGVMDAEVALLDSDPDDWWRTMEVNVRGAYLMTRAVGRHMRAAGGGRVINLNSGAGDRARARSRRRTTRARPPWPGSPGSTEIDGAGRRHPRLRPRRPGSSRTDMTRSMRSHDGRTEWTDPAEVVDARPRAWPRASWTPGPAGWSGPGSTPGDELTRARPGRASTAQARTIGLRRLRGRRPARLTARHRRRRDGSQTAYVMTVMAYSHASWSR